MGKKSKAKTKKKKAAKKKLKQLNKKSSLKDANRLLAAEEKAGVDVGSLASSALAGIPFVGPLLGDIADQAITSGAAGGQVISGRGGVRGVQLVDSRLGNLGTISRKKALQVLMTRGKRPPRRGKPTFIQLPAGQSVVRV